MERRGISVIVTGDELERIAEVAEAGSNRRFASLVNSRLQGIDGLGRLGVRIDAATGEEMFSFPSTQAGFLRAALEAELPPPSFE